MVNIILILIIVALISAALIYIYCAKRRGQACIGCPHSKKCKKNSCGCDAKS